VELNILGGRRREEGEKVKVGREDAKRADLADRGQRRGVTDEGRKNSAHRPFGHKKDSQEVVTVISREGEGSKQETKKRERATS